MIDTIEQLKKHPPVKGERRYFSDALKRAIVERIRGGEMKQALMDEFGFARGMLSKWSEQFPADAPKVSDLALLTGEDFPKSARGFRMYSPEFKRYVALEHQKSGAHLRDTAAKFKIDEGRVRLWVSQYAKKPFKLTVLPVRKAEPALPPFVPFDSTVRPTRATESERAWHYCPHCGKELK